MSTLAYFVSHLGPARFDLISYGFLWSDIKLIWAGTPVGDILDQNAVFRKILYGALWTRSGDNTS